MPVLTFTTKDEATVVYNTVAEYAVQQVEGGATDVPATIEARYEADRLPIFKCDIDLSMAQSVEMLGAVVRRLAIAYDGEVEITVDY